MVFSDSDALALRLARIAPCAAIDVTAFPGPGEFETAVRVLVVALDIEASAGFVSQVSDAYRRRDSRPLALCLTGVSERLATRRRRRLDPPRAQRRRGGVSAPAHARAWRG